MSSDQLAIWMGFGSMALSALTMLVAVGLVIKVTMIDVRRDRRSDGEEEQ